MGPARPSGDRRLTARSTAPLPLPGAGLSQNLENNPMQSSQRSEEHDALHRALDLSGKSPADFHHCAIRRRAASRARVAREFSLLAAGAVIPDPVSSPALAPWLLVRWSCEQVAI